MARVKLVNIEKRWGAVQGVAPQTLEVADGEFMVFLGPSGCGKTTLMRMVAGLEAPSAGEVWIGGRDVTHAAPKARDVAMVFQNYGLYPHMSVADNIGYPLKVRGMDRRQRMVEVERVAAKVELTHLLNRRPRDLSGGQRQRVALARAIVRHPQVFLMDEPLSNLDAQLRVSMRAEIRRLHDELRVTTIYVTHDQIEAMTLADRIVVMRAGTIQQVGTPDDIYNRPANLFVAGFVGAPAMNLLSAQRRGSRVTVCAQDLSMPVPAAAGDTFTLGIRPEDVLLTEPDAGDLHARVILSEHTGDATLVTVQAGEARLCLRADRHLRPSPGQTAGVRLLTAHCHFFDTESGQRLGD